MKREVRYTQKDKWKVKLGFIEAIKKIPFINALILDYDEYKHWAGHWQYYGDDPNFKVPSLIQHMWDNYKRRQKIKKCNHDHMEVDAHITGDSGSEDFYCPDCGFTDHIQYY